MHERGDLHLEVELALRRRAWRVEADAERARRAKVRLSE